MVDFRSIGRSALYCESGPAALEMIQKWDMQMALGLQRGIVRLVPHAEEWGRLFEEEKTRIATCLRGKIFDIEHVGSTAIPGLPAKPIIDIALGVPDLNAIGEYAELLVQIGYEYRGDQSGDGNHVFAKGAVSRRTHYLHVIAKGSSQWNDYLLFRDYVVVRRLGEPMLRSRDAWLRSIRQIASHIHRASRHS